jgi:hypothetical protein
MLTTSLHSRVAISAAALLAVLGCSTNGERSDIIVTALVRPTISSGATGGAACVLSASTLEDIFGTVDPAVAATYTMGLVVANELPNNANAVIGRLNSNDFQIEQVRIGYSSPDGSIKASLAEQVVPANGLVLTGTSNAVGTVVFPPAIITALKGSSGTIRVSVRAEGHLLDGAAAKSSTYEYAIQVCAGCGATTPACTAPKVAFVCALGQNSDTTCQ